MNLAIRLLGPFEVRGGGALLPAGGPTQRAVLAMLALRAGRPVPVDELVDGIWGERDEPAVDARWLWPHISRIRALLKDAGGQPLSSVPGGYQLRADGLTIDAPAFEQLLATGRGQLAAGETASAAETFDGALALWRGPALMDLRDFPFAATLATRYDELRIDAAEERAEAYLALGREEALLPELYALVTDHPYRERLHGQLMLALYRAGRQVAALEAYQAARGRLSLDLGVAPGPELERLHIQILNQADALVPPRAIPRARDPAAIRPASVRLPATPALIGREDQLADLERQAERERLITLVGAGGSGKTVLALALVHRLRPRFADGATFVDLAAVDRPQRVLPAIANALGVVRRDARLGERLADYLAGHRVLLMLDNLEHVLDAAADLVPLVNATIGLVVATSRSPLGLRAEHVIQVQPLPVPAPGDDAAGILERPAVQLFLRAADAVGGQVGRSVEEIAAVGTICRAVDGLPLAIEIVAAQTVTETLPELAAHLAERLPGLRGRRRDAPARQRTVEAAIGWSIDRLVPRRRAQLSRLSVFSGSFGVRGAASVCGVSRERAIGLLTDLLDASLVIRQASVADEARFRILQPIRMVARARAASAELATATARQAAFLQTEIDRLCPAATGIRRPEDLALLRAEHPDLIAALGHLVGVDPNRCMRLVLQLDDYWSWTGRELEAKRLADDLLASGRLSARNACAALIVSGTVAFFLGRPEEVRRAMARMLEMSGTVRDASTRALVHEGEARYWSTVAGEGDRVRTACEMAALEARRAGDQRMVARCLALRAIADPGAPDAGPGLEEAIRIARDGGMAHTEFRALTLLALWLWMDDRDTDEAARVARVALEVARRYDALDTCEILLSNIGEHLLWQGSIEEAGTTLVAALRTADLEYPIGATAVMDVLGQLEAARHHWEAAMILLTASGELAAEFGSTGLSDAREVERHDAALRAVTRELGAQAAAAARARGEAMTYREAVDYAYEVNGVPLTDRREMVDEQAALKVSG